MSLTQAEAMVANSDINHACRIDDEEEGETTFTMCFVASTDDVIKRCFEQYIVEMLQIDQPKILVRVALSGWCNDPRPLRDIPEAKALMKQIVAIGLYGMAKLPEQIGKQVMMPAHGCSYADQRDVCDAWYHPIAVAYCPYALREDHYDDWMVANYAKICTLSTVFFQRNFEWATSRASIEAHAAGADLVSIESIDIRPQPSSNVRPQPSEVGFFQGQGHRLGDGDDIASFPGVGQQLGPDLNQGNATDFHLNDMD